MIGLHELTALRMRGFSPGNVWLHVLDEPADFYTKRDAQESISNGFQVTLLLNPDEPIAALDLSALYGLVVHIIGKSARRCLSLFNLCKPIAKRVLASGFDDDILDSDYA